MESKLSRLFDYQKFEPNSRLDKLIKDVESRYSLEDNILSDDELGMINAAGVPEVFCDGKRDKDQNLF
jgi:hypothetical protein